MAGLLGWISRDETPWGEQELISMAQAGHVEPDALTSTTRPTAGLATVRTVDPVGLHCHDNVLVAVIGAAHWSDSALATQSAQNGLAASIHSAYRTHGMEFLSLLHGAFGLAIVDSAARTGMLAIDRLGIQPLAFAHSAESLVFASDARSVAAHPATKKELNPQGIFNYLFFHMVPSPGSIFNGVEKLLPGERVIWRQGKIARDFYWRLPYGGELAGDFADKASRMKSLLADAVRRAADSDQVGAFLSGGTDSSTVVGMLTQTLKKPAETFSIGFDAEGYDEMEFARLASRHFGTHPHEYYLTPADVVTAIPKIAAAYDEPFGNASAVPTYFCAKVAHEAGVRVMLAGDGGDEIFGGNARYAKQKVFEFYWSLPAWARENLLQPLSDALPGVGPLRKAKSYVDQARIPLPDRLETYNFLRREPLGNILAPDFLTNIQSEQPESLLREVYQRADANSFIDRMLFLDLKFTLADNDLRKVNRTTEMAGVAVRYPMLDESLVEFSAKLTPDEKVHGQYLRYFFKKAVGDFLPREIIDKSKHGFGLPFGLWMQTHAELHALAGDSLSSLRKRNIVRPEYIDRLLNQHGSGHASYYGVMIWVLMMLEQWLQAHKR